MTLSWLGGADHRGLGRNRRAGGVPVRETREQARALRQELREAVSAPMTSSKDVQQRCLAFEACAQVLVIQADVSKIEECRYAFFTI